MIDADELRAARTHTEHGRVRKRQLVDAAERLFGERGYAATRVADICRESGVTKSLFYWYFPTKRDLFAELVQSMRLGLRRAQAAAMDHTADAVTQIGQGAEASVRFMADHAPYFALVDVEGRDGDVAEVLASGSEVFLDDVRRLVEAGQRDGSIATTDATLVAIGVLGSVSSFSSAYRGGRLRADMSVDELARFVGHWVTSALR